MDVEMLSRLAEFLGVDADEPTVAEALRRLIEQLDASVATAMEDDEMKADIVNYEEDEAKMEGEEEEVAEKNAVLVEELKAALGVKSVKGVAARLAKFYIALQEAQQPAPVLNYGALKAANKQLVNTAPAVKSAPTMTSRQSNGHGTSPKKSARYGGIGIGGKAQKPSITSMVADLMAGKSHNYEIGPLGGYVVREEVREELIPVLRAQMVLEQAGVRVTQLNDATSLQLPKMRTAPEAWWVGINEQVPEDNAEFDVITLNPKPIAARTRVPRRMIQTMYADAEQRIQDEILRSIRLKIEYAALFGSGGVTGSNNGAEPVGLLNTPNVTNTPLATNGAQPKLKDVINAMNRIEVDNIELGETARYIMHPRDYNTFAQMTDTTGQPVLRQSFIDGAPGQINGYEVLKTTQIPINVTTGTNADTSYIFAGEWRFMELAFGGGIEIQVLNELYADRLQVGIVAHTYADMAVHYGEAFEILSGVRA